jgi:hypothetical protein
LPSSFVAMALAAVASSLSLSSLLKSSVFMCRLP